MLENSADISELGIGYNLLESQKKNFSLSYSWNLASVLPYILKIVKFAYQICMIKYLILAANKIKVLFDLLLF